LLREAEKSNLALDIPSPSVTLLRSLPIWHHKYLRRNQGAKNNSKWADCQRLNHGIMTVGEMLDYIRVPFTGAHRPIAGCGCDVCRADRLIGCNNPTKCREAATRHLSALTPRWNPE
ncbi:hypothetical protein CPC08DRAFT_622525, partial [Agrocybe pediades]